MTTTAILLREIETMPEAVAAEVLDFAMFIKGRHTPAITKGTVNMNVPSIKDAHGIFKDLKGMDTTIERDAELYTQDKHFENLDRVHFFSK